jgi:hypothetical protein
MQVAEPNFHEFQSACCADAAGTFRVYAGAHESRRVNDHHKPFTGSVNSGEGS